MGVAIKLNLMPIDWYLQSEQGRRAAKHVIEGTLTDEETGEPNPTIFILGKGGEG